MKDPYLYPGTEALKNLFGVEDIDTFEAIEADYTGFRIKSLAVNPIDGDFDFAHLCEIHKYIFQDIFEWAGEPRIINTFCVDFAEQRGFPMNRTLFAENSEYVRTALVAASAIIDGYGDLSKPEYIERFVADALSSVA